jgi:hypothetical protein
VQLLARLSGFPGEASWALRAAVAITGLVAGGAFAEKTRRNKGTIEFMSRTIAHPELCEKELTNDPSRIK